MSDDTTLIDTNILVHAYNTFDKEKHEKCKHIVESAFHGEAEFAISNQILAELFSVLTKKIEKPLPPEEAGSIVSGIIDSTNWIKINYNHETVKKAISSAKTSKASIWDSIIIETALENGIKKIFTENIRDFKDPRINAKNPVE